LQCEVIKLLRNISVGIALLLCLAACLPQLERARADSQPQDSLARAESLLALSEQQNEDNHGLALQTAQQALGLWQAAADQPGIARCYAMIGRCHFAQSDLPEAMANYEKALQIWRELNRPQEQAAMLIMQGFIENRRADWSNAFSLYFQAQKLLEEHPDPGQLGQIASGLADIFNENGLPESGLIHYQRALEAYRQTPGRLDDALTIWAIGSTYYLLGNYPEALQNLQQALAEVAPESAYAAICNEYLGRVYQSLGDYTTARQHLQAALAGYLRAGNPKEEARVRGLLGQGFEQQGRSALAQRYYREALETFTRLSDRLNQAALCHALGRLSLKRRNFKAAEEYLKKSIDVTDGIRRVSTSRDLTAAFSATVHERYEKYIECLMQQSQAQDSRRLMVQAFETSEASRARSLAEMLRTTQTNLLTGVEAGLAEQEKSLRQMLKAKEDAKVALLGRVYQPEELVALEAELARLQAEYHQVSETIEQRYPSYREITRPSDWDLPRIQEQVIVDDQTLLLEYSLGAEQSYLWAVTRDEIKSYRLAPRTRINQAAQRVYQLLARPPDADSAKEISQAVEELSRMVLSPVASELTQNRRRILIVADGALHYIPFQILLTPSGTAEPLVAGHEIINTPSAAILGELRRQAVRQQPSKLLAAFGDAVFPANYAQRRDAAQEPQAIPPQTMENARWQQAMRDIELSRDSFDPSDIKPLLYTKRELATLREAASGSETFIASGFAACREQLLSTDLSQYAILHFATHGLLDPKRPENSGLVLSTVNYQGQTQNGFVALQDIYGLRAPVELVVLSACQTALGKDVRGEGLLGLTRGFMYAGASSVVASLWKVDDEATAELMRQFYLNLLQRQMTPAAALQAAQNSLRQRPEWQMPYYWAGFTLQGEYRQVIHGSVCSTGTRASYQRNLFFSGALLLLAGGASWFGYRRLQKSRKKIAIQQ
jgi:CHAT domain-containing protein